MVLRFTMVILATAIIGLTACDPAQASPEREFIMSCTYGVMAGTLVGAATLAFSSNPGNNLQNVARGASIGLYVGIALGYYTAYMLPKQLEKEQEDKLNKETDSQGRHFRVFPFFVADGANTASGAGLHWEF
jgi:hypothetical protein